MDYSIFKYGIVVVIRYYENFLDNIFKELIRGGKVDIIIVIDNYNYDLFINFFNLNRKDDVIRLIFGKKLKEFLLKELNLSY